MATKRESDDTLGREVWSTVISAKGEQHRYSSSGGSSERTYYKVFNGSAPPTYHTFHDRKGRMVKVSVTRPDTVAEIDYNVSKHRKG